MTIHPDRKYIIRFTNKEHGYHSYLYYPAQSLACTLIGPGGTTHFPGTVVKMIADRERCNDYWTKEVIEAPNSHCCGRPYPHSHEWEEEYDLTPTSPT